MSNICARGLAGGGLERSAAKELGVHRALLHHELLPREDDESEAQRHGHRDLLASLDHAIRSLEGVRSGSQPYRMNEMMSQSAALHHSWTPRVLYLAKRASLNSGLRSAFQDKYLGR